MKICILGNSVGFKIRPPRNGPGEVTYSEILEKAGHNVRNVSRAGVTLGEAFGLLDEDVLTFFPDVVIVHHGVVEVCQRRTVRSWNNAAIPNVYLNSVFRRRHQFNDAGFKIANVFWRSLNWATRVVAAAIGLKWQWQAPRLFVETLKATCHLILKETSASILVLGITPCSSRVQRILPGSAEAIVETNRLLRQLCEELGPRVRFVETETWMSEADLPRLSPDGIHFSAEGHSVMAQKIKPALQAFLPLAPASNHVAP